MSQHHYIHVLRGAGGGILVVDPFGPGSPVYEESRGNPADLVLSGRFGAEPKAESIAQARLLLDASLEAGVARHILDRGFALRVALAALSFLLAYFFFSIAVRDPIPFLDEFALGGIAAFVAWTGMARRSRRKPGNRLLLDSLRAALGRAIFSESRVAALAEEWIDEARAVAGSGPAALEAWLAQEAPSLDTGSREELELLASALRRELGKPGAFGGESEADLDARLKRAILRLARRGPGRRDAELSAVLAKSIRVLAAGRG